MTPTSILSALFDAAADHGERPALTVLGREGARSWTFDELVTRVAQVATRLTELGARGERVLLACPTSLEYAPVFYGCMLAGALPVPVYLPSVAHVRAARSKIEAIARDCGAAFAVTPSPIDDLPGPRVQVTFDDLLTGAPEWAWAVPGPGDLAFLQYTSGSTGDPKGVMVTHGGLVHNASAVGEAVGGDRDTTTVSWLPLYHDMGLIGSVVTPLFWGAHVVKMSPQAFVAQPYAWLRALSDHGGELAYAPNFAYELCLRKVTDEQLAGLDLSRWRVAINGAEPIRQATVARFAERFAPAGFRPEHMRFAYGMAEATLVVTTQRWTDPEAEVVVGGRAYPRCGEPIRGTTVAIADPETGRPCPPGEVGEIWVSGPSVAAGYWERLDATEETFHARLPGREETYLRTGDLGVLSGGGVAVVGRHKDLIVINGVNHYPQDVEYTVERVDPAVRGGCTAAFSAEPTGDVPQGEAAVVVAEVRRDAADPAALLTEIRLAVAREHDVLLDGVFLVEPGSVPKTTSGKIRRRATRDLLLARELPVVAGWTSEALAAPVPEAAPR
ncbi:Putative fatty-acid--CoA ligase fadD21 [Nonomuraea coxensis DSM 45129]|uniref:Fatty-acid--CoA ligase fadD21 n=1 Tax=Nonomuraea coxensis DSM 45129 TaxID=1122611 RepID=A0ABX8U1R0_9ACTN|nr:fatty acyl-AMP ligase [Nonomuraea coxensis]QYC41599.1 Putative fatty-acid--CoA ligase fadD21 [Nonomuraea coxensis DSM 45129]